MSDTPETDDEWNRFADKAAEEFARKLYEHAQRMERERNKARGIAAFYRGRASDTHQEPDLHRFPWEDRD